MIDFLHKFFGLKIDGSLRIVSAGLQLRNSGAGGWVFLLALALGGLAWWTYRELPGCVPLGDRRRRILIGLRTALFLAILFILLRPVISFTLEGSIRRLLVCLFDTSASMGIQDQRTDAMDVTRASLYCKVADPKHVSRIDLVRDVLVDTRLRLLPELKRNFDLGGFAFGGTVTRLEGAAETWPATLAAKSPTTAIGDAIRDVIGRKRGQPLAGIFMVTDGASNAGADALEAARLAKTEGAPLYIYGTGITSPKDIVISNLFTQDVAFVKDELPVTVRVRGQGLKGEKGRLLLKLGDETVSEKEVEFTGESEQTVSLKFTPKTTGEFALQASIAPREDETVKDNNSVSQRLSVVDSKIKILFIEQAPRWEFRYLQNIFLRDRRVELKCVLLEGDPAIVAAEQSPYLDKIPPTKEALLKYDLLIVGDVDPKAFTPAQLDAVGEFVSKFGGSCILLAGKRSNPSAYKEGWLQKLLPVELEALDFGEKKGGPTSLTLTPLGRANPMLRLSQQEEENAVIWSKFPPVQWTARVSRAKPGAQVLMEDPDPAHTTRFGRMPVIAFQQYGLGQVLYVGTDNSWRWRKNGGEAPHALLWSRIAQRMALAHLLGGAKRTQLSVDKQNYTTGERVTVYARLYSEGFEPVKDATVRGSFTVGNAGAQEVNLRAMPNQLGMFRGDFVAITPGTYRFSVASDAKTVVEFAATEPRFELGETAMNESLLRAMADASGGVFFREEDLSKVPSAISHATEQIRSEQDVELWATPFYFALMLALATTEWVLRKRWNLK